MQSRSPDARVGVVMLFTVLLALGSVGCADSRGDGAAGSGGSAGSGGTAGSGGAAGSGGTPGTENPCLQPNDPTCSSATLPSGFGEVRIFFDEQRVEAASDSAFPSFASKGGAGSTLFLVSAYEETADCMTNQPGDLFSKVACVPYWNDSFIQAEVGKWFRLVFTEGASGNDAPVTMRLTSDSAGAYALEATWGAFACDEGGSGVQVCFGDTVGDGAEDGCCREDGDCESNRCCTGPEQCSFDELDNRYTCRRPR
jgi:hypothetical protein